MLPLNVPFLPEASYICFLNNLGPRLHAVHFSLHDPVLWDARVRLEQPSLQTIIDLLAHLPGPKKYLLANGRFQPTGTYTGPVGLSVLIERLQRLLDTGVLDGLIFADSYLLAALGDAAPAIVSRLEAIPSVNFSIDNIGKMKVLMDCNYSASKVEVVFAMKAGHVPRNSDRNASDAVRPCFRQVVR